MRVLDTRKGEVLRAADACCEKQSKQVAEERVSERSIWESIGSIQKFCKTLNLGLNMSYEISIFYTLHNKQGDARGTLNAQLPTFKGTKSVSFVSASILTKSLRS